MQLMFFDLIHSTDFHFPLEQKRKENEMKHTTVKLREKKMGWDGMLRQQNRLESFSHLSANFLCTVNQFERQWNGEMKFGH